MRKTVGALLMTISVLLVAAGTAAASTAPAGGAQSVAGALGLTPVDGSAVAGAHGAHGLSVTVDPGRSTTKSVVVSNHSATLRLTVHLDANGAAAPWLTLSDVVETLEPRASANVTVDVQVPANAVPGSMKGGIVASVESAVRAADGSPVGGSASVSVPIAVAVNGAATAQVSIVGVSAVEEQGHKFLEIQFENVGKTSMEMSGTVHVPHGHPSSYSVRANAAALTTTVVRIPWVPPSSGAVGITASATDARGDQASWSGSVGGASTPTAAPSTTPETESVQTAVTSGHVGEHGLSLVFLLIAIALAALWLLYEVLRARARTRGRIRRLAAVVASIPGEPGSAIATPGAIPGAIPVVTPVATGPAVASVAVAAAASSTPVVVSAEQVNAVAAQLAALVNAIDRLTDRLDGQPAAPGPVSRPRVVAAPAPALAAAPGPIAPADVAPADVAPADDAPAAPVAPPRAPDAPDPFDWPTEEQLERFAEGRRAARREFE